MKFSGLFLGATILTGLLSVASQASVVSVASPGENFLVRDGATVSGGTGVMAGPREADPGHREPGEFGGQGTESIIFADAMDLGPVPIPEPASYALIGLGLLAILRRRRNR